MLVGECTGAEWRAGGFEEAAVVEFGGEVLGGTVGVRDVTENVEGDWGGVEAFDIAGRDEVGVSGVDGPDAGRGTIDIWVKRDLTSNADGRLETRVTAVARRLNLEAAAIASYAEGALEGSLLGEDGKFAVDTRLIQRTVIVVRRISRRNVWVDKVAGVQQEIWIKRSILADELGLGGKSTTLDGPHLWHTQVLGLPDNVVVAELLAEKGNKVAGNEGGILQFDVADANERD